MSATAPRLEVVAHSVHPYPSSEGVAGAAFLGAVLAGGARVRLATSAHGYRSPQRRSEGRPAALETFAYDATPHAPRVPFLLDRLARWTHHSPTDPRGMIARLVDRARVAASLPTLRSAAWARAAARWLARPEAPLPDARWARATPYASFDAALRAHRLRPAPLVACYNDPLPFALLAGPAGHGYEAAGLERFQRRLNRRLAAEGDAFVFPSRRLAKLMADAAGFAPARCFIVPHTVPDDPDDGAAPAPVIAYLGTFYGSLFGPQVREGLRRFCAAAPPLRLRLVLRRPPEEVVAWVRRELPGTELLLDVAPAEAAGLRRNAAALLVLGERRHAPLLPMKVVEAVTSGRPVVALAPHGTTTADVVGESGGTVLEPEAADAVAEGLAAFAAAVAAGTVAPASACAARFSPARIAADAFAVSDYARRRFSWRAAGRSGPEPELPTIEAWP